MKKNTILKDTLILTVITLISGLIFVVLTIFGVRDLIVKAIPKNIKVAIGRQSVSTLLPGL